MILSFSPVGPRPACWDQLALIRYSIMAEPRGGVPGGIPNVRCSAEIADCSLAWRLIARMAVALA
ncbi:MAG: hypothetical protein CMO32_21970 [Variovorax sp.]|nr:hypothetical protein [Variovorax sp.]